MTLVTQPRQSAPAVSAPSAVVAKKPTAAIEQKPAVVTAKKEPPKATLGEAIQSALQKTLKKDNMVKIDGDQSFSYKLNLTGLDGNNRADKKVIDTILAEVQSIAPGARKSKSHKGSPDYSIKIPKGQVNDVLTHLKGVRDNGLTTGLQAQLGQSGLPPR